MEAPSTEQNNFEGWNNPYQCSDFINTIVHRQQLPLATSLISRYIEQNNLQKASFRSIENDVQSDNPTIKQYLFKQSRTNNKQYIKALFIDICSLIEAAPITDRQFNMMSIQLTRLAFDEFPMEHRRKCMKYIIIDAKFDNGIHGLWEDLAEYDPEENLSDVIDYICDIGYDTKEQMELWLYYLKRAICEYAYHPPTDAVIFIKEVQMQLKRDKNNDYDHDVLYKLEHFLLNHAYNINVINNNDDSKNQQQKPKPKGNSEHQINSFEWLKNDLYNAVNNDTVVSNNSKQLNISEVAHILDDTELIEFLHFQATEICNIQNIEFQHLFVNAREGLWSFKLKNRMKAAQYIVNKYVDQQTARNDKDGLMDKLLDIRVNENISHLIFPGNEDEKQNVDLHLTPSDSDEPLFAMRRQCDTYLNAIFPQQLQTHREFAEENWNEEDCKRMLNRCDQIINNNDSKAAKQDWIPNAIKMLSKLGPNRAIDWSSIDARYAIFGAIKRENHLIDKHALSWKFNEYLKRYYSYIDLEELEMKELSDNITNRFLPYIPIVMALLTSKASGICEITQRAIIEISFRIADIMIAFKLKHSDQIIHLDLIIFYEEHHFHEMEKKLKKQGSKTKEIKIRNKNFYPPMFEKITQKIGKLPDAEKNVVRIMMLLNQHNTDRNPKIVVEFTKLKALKNKDDIDDKINNKKDPIYLPHIFFAFDRYRNIPDAPTPSKAKRRISDVKSRLSSLFGTDRKDKPVHNNFASKTRELSETSVTEETEDTKNDEFDNSDGDTEYVNCIQSMEGENGDERDVMTHLQYSSIVFPKLLDDDENRRIYINKQFLFMGRAMMPFKRSDVIDLVPTVFGEGKNTRVLNKGFIENMEREYGNSKRRQFFYDSKYDLREKLFHSFEPDKIKENKTMAGGRNMSNPRIVDDISITSSQALRSEEIQISLHSIPSISNTNNSSHSSFSASRRRNKIKSSNISASSQRSQSMPKSINLNAKPSCNTVQSMPFNSSQIPVVEQYSPTTESNDNISSKKSSDHLHHAQQETGGVYGKYSIAGATSINEEKEDLFKDCHEHTSPPRNANYASDRPCSPRSQFKYRRTIVIGWLNDYQYNHGLLYRLSPPYRLLNTLKLLQSPTLIQPMSPIDLHSFINTSILNIAINGNGNIITCPSNHQRNSASTSSNNNTQNNIHNNGNHRHNQRWGHHNNGRGAGHGNGSGDDGDGDDEKYNNNAVADGHLNIQYLLSIIDQQKQTIQLQKQTIQQQQMQIISLQFSQQQVAQQQQVIESLSSSHLQNFNLLSMSMKTIQDINKVKDENKQLKSTIAQYQQQSSPVKPPIQINKSNGITQYYSGQNAKLQSNKNKNKIDQNKDQNGSLIQNCPNKISTLLSTKMMKDMNETNKLKAVTAQNHQQSKPSIKTQHKIKKKPKKAASTNERNNNELYYEPSTNIRAYKNVSVASWFITKLKFKIKGDYKKVKCCMNHTKMDECKCDGIYSWIDIDIALHGNNLKRERDAFKIFNHDLIDKDTNENVFCVVESIKDDDVKDNDSTTQPKNGWKMKEELYTKQMIMDKYKLSKPELPNPIRMSDSFKNQLSQKIAIQSYLEDETNWKKLMHDTKWCKMKVFSKLNNKRRSVLFIKKPEFRSDLLDKPKEMKLFPVILFINDNYQIHYMIIVLVHGSNIGLSMIYDKEKEFVKITGIHLYKSIIYRQHQWVSLDHMATCNCLDNFYTSIDHLEIGNPDAAANTARALKQQHTELKIQLKDLVVENEELKKEKMDLTDELENLKQLIWFNDNSSPSSELKFYSNYDSSNVSPK